MQQEVSARLSRNNFDLLRLLFAGTVCLVHAHQLSGFRELAFLSAWLSSSVAVKAFFVVSGFLVFMSFERSPSLAAYAGKRVRRIYPAYLAVVAACAACLFAVSSSGPADYFSAAWARYVLANLAFLNFLQPTLPGVFAGNAVDTVNGALWTLKIEVMFYVSVPVFAWLFGKFSRLPVLALAYGASVGYAAWMASMAARTGDVVYLQVGRQLPGQLAYFMAGAFLYYYRDLFQRRVAWFIAVAVPVLVVDQFHPLPWLEPFSLAAMVIFFGLFCFAGNFGRYGDFSYGIYILHFPLIQVLVQSGAFRDRPWAYLATVVVVTACGAIVLWHAVEKRFLSRGSHYKAALR